MRRLLIIVLTVFVVSCTDPISGRFEAVYDESDVNFFTQKGRNTLMLMYLNGTYYVELQGHNTVIVGLDKYPVDLSKLDMGERMLADMAGVFQNEIMVNTNYFIDGDWVFFEGAAQLKIIDPETLVSTDGIIFKKVSH